MRVKTIKVKVEVKTDVEVDVVMPLGADEDAFIDNHLSEIHELVKDAVFNELTEDETSIEEWSSNGIIETEC